MKRQSMFRCSAGLWYPGFSAHFLGSLLAVWGLAGALLQQTAGQETRLESTLPEQLPSQEPNELEIRLRSQVELTEPIVRLADLADLVPSDSPLAQRLAPTELFPAPAPGARRYVGVMEIEEILLRRGFPVGQIRLTGAAQVEIRRQRVRGEQPSAGSALGGDSAAGSTVGGGSGLAAGSASAWAGRADAGRPTPVHRRRTDSPLQKAILAYLQEKVPGQTGWEIQLSVNEEWKKILNAGVQVVEVRGGAPPWTGAQWFELILQTPQGTCSLVVQAEVSVPTCVVAAARPIAKGALLQAQDLVLQPLPANENPEGYFRQIEELVGKETLRGLPAGRPIPQDAVQSPLLVRRGQTVTVYARAPGIRVRTQARAKDDGSLGDLVAVESPDRKTYFARVCGLQEVEVFARGVHTETPPGLGSETISSARQSAPTGFPAGLGTSPVFSATQAASQAFSAVPSAGPVSSPVRSTATDSGAVQSASGRNP